MNTILFQSNTFNTAQFCTTKSMILLITASTNQNGKTIYVCAHNFAILAYLLKNKQQSWKMKQTIIVMPMT